MSKEKKFRRICFKPENKMFHPDKSCKDNIILSFEECESIRLIDHEGMKQTEASLCMGVSRGTFQRILYSARYKISDAIISGKGIIIQGGDYKIADTQCNHNKKCTMCKFELDISNNKGEN